MNLDSGFDNAKKFVIHHKNGIGQFLGDARTRIRAAVDPEVRQSYIYKVPYGWSRDMAEFQTLRATGIKSPVEWAMFQRFVKEQLMSREQTKNPQFRWGSKLVETDWPDFLEIAAQFRSKLIDEREIRGRTTGFRWELGDPRNPARIVSSKVIF